MQMNSWTTRTEFARQQNASSRFTKSALRSFLRVRVCAVFPLRAYYIFFCLESAVTIPMPSRSPHSSEWVQSGSECTGDSAADTTNSHPHMRVNELYHRVMKMDREKWKIFRRKWVSDKVVIMPNNFSTRPLHSHSLLKHLTTSNIELEKKKQNNGLVRRPLTPTAFIIQRHFLMENVQFNVYYCRCAAQSIISFYSSVYFSPKILFIHERIL